MDLLHFTVRAWAGWASGSDSSDAKGIPSLLRRRVTALGRNALGAACSLPELDKVRYVFSSRHGEFSRTLSILKSIVDAEALSPTDFSMSVHHALVGLLSISQNNHSGHTAVAAGEESFCFGLIEALACLAEAPQDPVMLIHCDEPLPGGYAAFNRADDRPVALALLLGEGGGQDFGVQSYAKIEGGRQNSIALDFLNFLNGCETEADSASDTRHWRWVRYGTG